MMSLERFEPKFAKRIKTTPEPEKVAGSKEKDAEILELRCKGEKIYSKEFAGKLDEILDHEFKIKDKEGQGERIVLKDVIDKHLEGFSSQEFFHLPPEKKAGSQKSFVQELVSNISRISTDNWSIDFKRTMKTGGANCSAVSILLGLILESTKEISGIKNIEYGMPADHAINIIHFSDGKFYFADSKANIFEDITKNADIEEKEGFKIYRIKELSNKLIGGIKHKIIPALPIKEGAIISYLGNLCAAYIIAQDELPGAFKKIYAPTPEEIKSFQWLARKELSREGAKEISQENSLSEEKFLNLAKIRDSFIGKLESYTKGEEFRKERKRWRERIIQEEALRLIIP